MTLYWVRVRYHRSGEEKVIEYDSPSARAFALIMLAPYVDVLGEGVSSPEVH
jgi:hypothetical protein